MMLLVLSLALVLPTSVMLALYPASPAGAATDLLPDLRMARLTDFNIERTSDGRRLMRFSSVIVNTGDGRFEVRGSRPDTSSDTIPVRQFIYNTDGGFRKVSTPAEMYFSGDGHDHWHVRDLEEFTLKRMDNGNQVGTGAKHGFCFYDNYRFGSTKPPFYTAARGACGHDSSELKVKMGVSVGWGDLYHYTLPGQYIDITGLPPGRYALRGVADQNNWFAEKNETNNHTWVVLKISNNDVSVVRYGPSA